MFIVSRLLESVAFILSLVFQALGLIIVVNALLTWVRPDPSNPIVMFLDRVSDTICNPIRRMIPSVVGGVDIAPWIAILLILFLHNFLVPTLQDMAIRLG